MPDAALPSEAVVLDEDLDPEQAIALLEGAGVDETTPVPVVLPRTRRDLAPAITEVRSTVDLRTLRRTREIAGPAPHTVGTGEAVDDVLERWPDGVSHAVVLRDGRGGRRGRARRARQRASRAPTSSGARVSTLGAAPRRECRYAPGPRRRPRPVRTARLSLRPATPDDADAVWQVRRRPGVDEWLSRGRRRA